jgi:acetolactate synthase-1/2/3 large subunit
LLINAVQIDAPPLPRTGADLLVDGLARAGVSTVFGVPGDTGVVFYDALYHRSTDIRHILARDERHAAFMADAYARTTGTVGVVEVSSGGGSTYVVGGLGESYAASVPVLVIASDIQATSRGTGALTEMDQRSLFSAVTKWQGVVESAADLSAMLAEALRQATTGRPAPVALIVPENVLDEEPPAYPARVDLSSDAVTTPREQPSADAAAVRRAAELLASATRPAIVAGSGVHWSRAWSELAALVDYAGIPVATTIHGKGAVSDDSAWYLGVVGGNGGSERANAYLRTADTVLFVGSRANATDTDGWTAPPRNGPKVIQIDIDCERAGRNFPGSIELVGDASAILRALHSAIAPGDPERCNVLSSWIAEHAARPCPVVIDDVLHDLLSAPAVIQVLHEVVSGRPHLVLADPGTPTPHVADLWRTPVPGRTVLAPRGHGPMGYAIPAAIGASLARPDATVVAVTADGSFAMSCGELETVARLGLPIIYVQLTNFSLGWIKMLQHLYTDRRYFSVDPGPTDAVLVAQASGLDGVRVHSLAQLRDAVLSAIEARRAIYIDVPVHHLIDEVPPVSSWQAALAGDAARPSY